MTVLDIRPGVAALQAWGGQAASFGTSNQTVVDKVPADIMHMIDPHWYQFPPMNPLWHGLLGFTIGVLGFISIIGNGMVIYIFSSTKSLKTPSNLLVINLAFADFLMMVTMSPAMVISCYYETWVFGPLACELYGCAGSLFGCASIWSMTMIAFDRYNVIVKGIAAKPMTNNGALLRILFIWMFALLWTLAPLFGWNRYVPEATSWSTPFSFIFLLFCSSYIPIFTLYSCSCT
ncbi:hypothetical protein ACJJTC_009828 [Scirpophaga incertulas]